MKIAIAVVSAGLLSAIAAFAQDPQTAPLTPIDVESDGGEVQPAPVASPRVYGIFGDFGRRPGGGGAIADVKVGVGTGDFTQATPRDLTTVGPTWDVRGVIGAHSGLGFEAAFTGSSRGIADVPGTSGDAGDTQLVSNGVEGDLRIAAPISAGDIVDLRPFAFGGLGWQYMTLWGDGAVDEDQDEGDHILTIPAGVGLEIGIGPLNLDVRGTYRHAVGSDLFGDASAQFDDDDAMHSFNIGAGIGVEL